MLENYIYRNLDRYGNCLISNSLYKRLGKTKILEDLKQHGFNCDIRVIETIETIEKNQIRTVIDKSTIVEIKR